MRRCGLRNLAASSQCTLLPIKSNNTTGVPSMPDEKSSCTWEKYVVMRCAVDRLKVRDKRQIFGIMRNESVDVDTLLVDHGVTLGEFSCFQVLGDAGRRSSRR